MKYSMTLAGCLLLLGSGCAPSGDRFALWFETVEQRADQARKEQMSGPARDAHESAHIVLPKRHLPRFLRILALRIDDGFDYRQLRRVREMLDGMSVGEVQSVKFPVTFQRRSTQLEIQIYLDDPQAMAVYFFSLPELIDLIDEQAVKFTEAMAVWDEEHQREAKTTGR